MPHPQVTACPHGYAERADCSDRLCRFRESNRKAARLRLERNRAKGLTSHGTPPVPVNKCPHGHQRKADCVTCRADYFRARYLRIASANKAAGLTVMGKVPRPADAPAPNAQVCPHGNLGKYRCPQCAMERAHASYRRKQAKRGKQARRRRDPEVPCPHQGGYRSACPICTREMVRLSAKRHDDRLRAMGLSTEGRPYIGRGRKTQVCPHGNLGVNKCPACRRWISRTYAHKRRQWEGEPPGVTIGDWMRTVDRYQGRCAYCGDPSDRLQMDHVMPLSRGGRHATGNVLPACKPCNNAKSSRLLVEWRFGSRVRRRPQRPLA